MVLLEEHQSTIIDDQYCLSAIQEPKVWKVLPELVIQA
jgi:hypothetical protein